MRLEAFDWDQHNIAKCQKHGLSVEQIEALFLSDPAITQLPGSSFSEDRFVALKAIGRKYVLCVFTLRAIKGELKIRVISARNARPKEVIGKYETGKKQET